MIERLFRNPKTTIIGLAVLIVVAFAFVWFGKSHFDRGAAFIMGGFALLFFKDPTKRWRQKLRRRPQRRTFQNPVSVASTPNP
jgi:hypothetical protein